mmetsp:Transcript_6447/g.7244  ORF Transcript_6447/g.7244 Transcript_6447/m.7244 type:complete len:107 (-) Transcript_6447:166-486(-)
MSILSFPPDNSNAHSHTRKSSQNNNNKKKQFVQNLLCVFSFPLLATMSMCSLCALPFIVILFSLCLSTLPPSSFSPLDPQLCRLSLFLLSAALIRFKWKRDKPQST